jgi:hypothetical protein
MVTGYSRSPRLVKGAIIQFASPLLMPKPNTIIFQYNPETMTRSLTPWVPPSDEQIKNDKKIENNLAQPYDPEETFNITLELDAADDLETPFLHPVAVATGVADRIAALEMLMYPAPVDTLSGPTSGTLTPAPQNPAAAGAGTVTPAQRQTIPLILFYFGPGRTVPVRITTFSIDEQAYSPSLYPLRAKVTLGLKVLDPVALVDDGSAAFRLAKACYQDNRNKKLDLAKIRNQENTVDQITALLPS